MLLANQIAGFLSFNISNYEVAFLHEGTYLLKLQTVDVILGGHGQACPKRLLKLSRGPFSYNLFYIINPFTVIHIY